MATESVSSPRGPGVLADALALARWNGRDLIRAINPRLHAMGRPTVDITAGYHWLKGRVPHDAAVRDVVAVVLAEATGHRYTGVQMWGPGHPESMPGQSRETGDLLGPLAVEDVLRVAADFTRGPSGAALVHADGDTLLTTAVWDATRQAAVPVLIGRGHGDEVVPEFVDMLFDQLAALRRLDDRTGGGPLSQRQARTALRDSLELIRTGRYTPATGLRLLCHAAGAAQIAGWLTFDAGLAPAAHRYQLLAIRLARAAGDTTTVSNVLGMLAYQHAAGANPRVALRFAHAAVEHSARAVPLVRARAWGRMATACASDGDLPGYRRAAERCRDLLDRPHPDNPASLYYLTPEQVDAEGGQALVDLAALNPRKRTVLLREAAELLTPIAARGPAAGYRRSGLLHSIHLVRSAIGARDADAVAQWTRVVSEHVPAVQSVRCRALLGSVRARASRQLRAAGHTDALDALRQALSTP
ncbi:hypothetical protein [Amycolatopsis sp. NPDC004079]|uniref:hypothetical protein n=1 Tax=Amycolatopsis sp. NPDC004079 TaxID=3154549 RepID=UPI0033AFD7F7